MQLGNKFKFYRLLMPALLFAVMFSSCKVTQPYQRSSGIADNKLYVMYGN